MSVRNSATVRVTSKLVLAGLVLAFGATPGPHYPLQYEGIQGYQRFLGATSEGQIPSLTFTFPGDSIFDQITYTIEEHASSRSYRQSASGIAKSVFHDDKIAEFISENGTIGRDNGKQLKDLVTREALITGRIAFMHAEIETPRTARVIVPNGWPVDLVFVPGGRLWRATIHGTDDEAFVPFAYFSIGSYRVVSSWLIGSEYTRAISVRAAAAAIPRPTGGPAWIWRAAPSPWTKSFVPYEGRAMMPISINGVRSQCFLDTGTAGIVISPKMAAEAAVPYVGPAFAIRSNGGLPFVYGRADIVAGPAELHSAIVFIGSYPLDGYPVCGYDFLASFLVEITDNTASVAPRPSIPPECQQGCVPLDTWSHSAIATLRIGLLDIERGSIDTGSDDPLVVADHLKYSGGGSGEPVNCGTHSFVERHLVIGAIDVGATPTCYKPITNPNYQAVVGSELLNHYRLTLDLGDMRLWLR